MNKEEIEYKISEVKRKIHIFEDSKESMENAIRDYEEELDKLKQELNRDEEEWTPKYDERYWYYNRDLERIDDTIWINDEEDKTRLKNKVIFKTEEEAQRYADYMKAKEKYSYEFSKEEWENNDIPKYKIMYNHHYNDLQYDTCYIIHDLSHLTFKTVYQAQEFIDKYKAEILEFEFGIKE